MYLFLSVSTLDYTYDATFLNNSSEFHFGMLVVLELTPVVYLRQ